LKRFLLMFKTNSCKEFRFCFRNSETKGKRLKGVFHPFQKAFFIAYAIPQFYLIFV